MRRDTQNEGAHLCPQLSWALAGGGQTDNAPPAAGKGRKLGVAASWGGCGGRACADAVVGGANGK